MGETLAKFDSPPVTETVLGVQFQPLSGWTSAHAGWFWKQHLDEGWARVAELGRLEDRFETFGEPQWRPRGELEVRHVDRSRIHVIRSDDDRLIQLQDSRLIYNWRKRKGDYPSYSKLIPDFESAFAAFREFVSQTELGELVPNQWEVTYINHLPKGELWREPADWPSVLPGLWVPGADVPGQDFDEIAVRARVTIREDRGRLHVALQRGRIQPDGPEVMMLEFTARGPLGKDEEPRVGLDLGHEAIVKTFLSITSEDAQHHWGRTQ